MICIDRKLSMIGVHLKPGGSRSPVGILMVFVVDDIDAEYMRLKVEGVTITTPIETESWHERFFQVTDPNGVVLQLVQWMTELTP